MRLKNVSKYFDTTVALDGYSGRKAFKCQLEPLDMFKTEGTKIKVRNLSSSSGVRVPTRGVISIGPQRYLITDSSLDHWDGEAIRARYVLQGADDLILVRTIQETLEDTPGFSAYASVDFNKYSTDERDNSNFQNQYHIFFAGSEIIPVNSILTSSSGKSFFGRTSYKTPAGLIDVFSDELPSPVTDSATFSARTYNPITDDYMETNLTVSCIGMRWQEHFERLNKSTTPYESGDIQLLVPLSVTPRPSDTLLFRGTKWTILSCIQEDGYWSLHVRLV